MVHSRREFLKSAATAATLSAVSSAEPATALSPSVITPNRILRLFEHLPGDKAVSIYGACRRWQRLPRAVQLEQDALCRLRLQSLCSAKRYVRSIRQSTASSQPSIRA